MDDLVEDDEKENVGDGAETGPLIYREIDRAYSL